MSDDTRLWREFPFNLISWYSPLIGNTGMRDAPTTSATDAEVDAEYQRAFAALTAAKMHAERMGLRLGLERRTMTAEELDAVWSEVQLAQDRIGRLGAYLNRLLGERARREAVRERDARIEQGRARLAELEQQVEAAP